MKVERLMTTKVTACRPGDNIDRAARIMWEEDCGSVPVVEKSRVLGMITDRDVCMAAYTQGRGLAEIPVEWVMSRELWSCHPDDELTVAEELMRSHQVRRLPVTDAEGRLRGLLSLSDIAVEAERAEREGARKKEVHFAEVGQMLCAITKPRSIVARETASVA